MSKLILPAQIHPPTIRKDGSVTMKFESRELTAEEYMIIMGYRNIEGWLTFSPNHDEIPEIPKERAEVDQRTPSERLRNVLFVWYKQESDKGKFVGTFEAFRNEKMEVIIEKIKEKLD